MLKVPSVSDITYDQMVQQAIQKIPSMTEEWTDFNYHDPGITVLQTYAWLVDMLNYYMDATGDIHIRKYMKLLGILPREAQAAKAYLNMESSTPDLLVRAGTPVYAGNICFETVEDSRINSNSMISYINEVDGIGIDLTMFAGMDGDYADLFSEDFEKQAAGYFGFGNELSGDVALQICVRENQWRNPFEMGFSMSDLHWQYYGENGWKDMEVREDGTGGLLRSGILKVYIPEKTVLYQYPDSVCKAHYIRCILKKNTYDKLPEIGKIYINPVLAEQKRTLSRVCEVEYQGEEELVIPYYIPENAGIMIGLREQEGFGSLLYREGGEEAHCLDVRKTGRPGERQIVFLDKERRPVAGSILQVFFVCEELSSVFGQGITDGCANQEIPFSFDGIQELSISLWGEEKNGTVRYEIWNYVPNLERAAYTDKVFTYDWEQGRILFGDGEHGRVPRPGQKICITGFAVSKFKDGNALEREITQVPGQMENLKVYNPMPAVGGRNLETMKDIKTRLETELFCQGRLVSVDDYKTVVKRTPGLMIEAVEVLSGKRYGEIHDRNWEDNEVVVVVKPYAQKKCPVLSDFYKESISAYIEEKRLINTKVSIVSPSYVGIEIYGKIELTHKRPQDQAAVLELLEELVDAKGEAPQFGKKLVLSALFSRLEMMEEVSRVHSLSIERLGKGAEKNQRGDIQLMEDALCYISDINLEFC
ncbi:MAG: baseplate J/gp47 family protein [Roseburia sp.]